MPTLPRTQTNVTRQQVAALLERLCEHDGEYDYRGAVRFTALILTTNEAGAEVTVARLLASGQLRRRGARIVVED